MLKKLKLGTIDLALPSTVMSSQVPQFGLFEMPYLVKSREHMARIREKIVFPKLVPIALKDGYRILGVWENGFRQITNNKRPIDKPADLQGIKLRTPKGTWRVKMFKAYGANPTPLAFSEVFVALKTGAMDGQENPYAQIYPARFYEVQKYLSITNHVYTPAYLTAGASFKRFAEGAEDPAGHGGRNAAGGAEDRRRPRHQAAGQAQGKGHEGEQGRHRRLHQGQQADL